MTTRVVHVREETFAVYVGRKFSDYHYGNPFVLGKDGTRNEVCDKHMKWLRGDKALAHVEPIRRVWILTNLHELEDKVLE